MSEDKIEKFLLSDLLGTVLAASGRLIATVLIALVAISISYRLFVVMTQGGYYLTAPIYLTGFIVCVAVIVPVLALYAMTFIWSKKS